jgi:hypothetical protein
MDLFGDQSRTHSYVPNMAAGKTEYKRRHSAVLRVVVNLNAAVKCVAGRLWACGETGEKK